MPRHERPSQDFWLTDLKSDLQIVATHTRAGFARIPDAVVRERLFILYDFLFTHGLCVVRLASSPEELAPDTALYNRHLTDEGYYFLQRFIERWQARLYKHSTAERERGFLEKWYRQFLTGGKGHLQ